MLKTPAWRFVAYAILILVGIAIALPSFQPRETARALPDRLPDRPAALGPDLRGGAAFEAAGIVDLPRIEGRDLVISTDEPNGPASSLRTAVASAPPTFQRGALSATEPAFSLGEPDAGTPRGTVLEAAKPDAMARNIEVARMRVDGAGVRGPSIQRLGTDRILVRMPGASDPSAPRSLLGSTADLTFRRPAPDPGSGRTLAADTPRRPMADGSGSVLVEARPALDGERLADAPAEMRALGRCSGCALENEDFSGNRLTSIDLRGANLADVVFDGAQLNLAIFENAVLSRVSFVGANLSGANFAGADLSDVSFEGANLGGAVFEGARLERTTLDAAHLCNTQMPLDEMDNSDCDGTWESPATRSRKDNAGSQGSGQ